MPNLDPWVNQTNNDYEDMTTRKTISKLENHLLSIKTERQEMIHPSSHPTYNERQQYYRYCRNRKSRYNNSWH